MASDDSSEGLQEIHSITETAASLPTDSTSQAGASGLVPAGLHPRSDSIFNMEDSAATTTQSDRDAMDLDPPSVGSRAYAPLQSPQGAQISSIARLHNKPGERLGFSYPPPISLPPTQQNS
jgi:hypothetical protein